MQPAWTEHRFLLTPYPDSFRFHQNIMMLRSSCRRRFDFFKNSFNFNLFLVHLGLLDLEFGTQLLHLFLRFH